MELNRNLCAFSAGSKAQEVKHCVLDDTTGMPKLSSCA